MDYKKKRDVHLGAIFFFSLFRNGGFGFPHLL